MSGLALPDRMTDKDHRVETGLPLRFRRQQGRRLRVNITSETAFWKMEGQGGHTGFLDCIDLMSQHPDLEVFVNSKRQCDVLHSHSWGPGYYLRGLRYPGRRILTAHAIPESAEGSLPFMCESTRAFVRRYLKGIYDFSNAVVAVDPRSAESLRRLPVRSPVEVVSNAIRTERFYPSDALRREGRALLGIDGRRPVVLGVGQVQPRKGIHDFSEVARAFPDVDFIWVGGRPFGLVSAGLQELNQLIATTPANLHFAGLHDLTVMPRLYNAADVMLFPSHQENCPYAPIEAAACGLPVIFRNLPVYAGLYRTAYCAADDAAGFTEILRSLLDDPARYALAQQRSRDLVASFQANAFIASIAALYDRVATGTGLQRPAA
jgi:1,2-diacylglycerol-3-alpha-glucose alpha-1,2-galactosyltransferase